MRLKSIQLSNFRCFASQRLALDSPVVVLEGPNGSGKTSVLEALFYGCYLRSFRTHISRDLMHQKSDHFYLEIGFQHQNLMLDQAIQIGVCKDQKNVKLDGRSVGTYKEIAESFSVIAATEEDIALISGSPELRRLFLSQAMVLAYPGHLADLKAYRASLAQRNRLILASGNRISENNAEFRAWTQQLWERGFIIRQARASFLQEIQQEVDNLIDVSKDVLGLEVGRILLDYLPKNMPNCDFDRFWEYYCKKDLIAQELRFGRTVFGSHLDDIGITYEKHKARVYASRGQQKLTVFLIKLAQARLLLKLGRPLTLIFDDFLTDFDQRRLEGCYSLLANFPGQIVLASPFPSFLGPKTGEKLDAQYISL